MRHEFRLADIGEGLEEAEIITWLVAVGDQVGRDQPLIEVMTDKSNAELPAPAAGTVIEISGAVGDMIAVGDLIAVIQSPDDVTADARVEPLVAAPAVVPAPSPDATPAAEVAAPAEPETAPPRPKAAPSTRREAAARGIDLSTVAGSGPGGRILLSDLDTATEAPPAALPAVSPVVTDTTTGTLTPQLPPPQVSTPPPPAMIPPSDVSAGTTVPLRGVRRAVAKNMAQSWSEIPHIHAFEHIDAQPLLDLRARLKQTQRPAYTSLTPLAFFVAAVGQALRAHPQANASIDVEQGAITYHQGVNVGIAVAAPQGLVVPVLRGADQLDFETLSLTLGQLVQAARAGSLPREHFLGGTVTVTNFGALGGEQATPLIRPPESMIVGFGSIAERPFVVESQVVARKTMHLVAGADHRLLDGDITTAVLNHIGSSLVDPLSLVL